MNSYEKIVNIHGQDLRVNIKPGVKGTAPLLLCCGIGTSFEALQPFVDALNPEIGVIRFDVPGVGGSPTGPVPYGYPGNAYLAAELIRELGYPQVDVLGISWGGGLAQQLALQHSQLVRRLILVGTSTGVFPAQPDVLRHLLVPRRMRGKNAVSALYGGSVREHPEHADILNGSEGTLAGYVHQLLAGWGWNSLPWLSMVCQPTLILAGDDDPIIPLANGRLLNRLLPHAQLHVYHGGHLALVTEADVLAPVVADFVTASPEDTAVATGLTIPSTY